MAILELTGVSTAAQAGRLDRYVRELSGRSWSDVRGMIHRGSVVVGGEVCQDQDRLIVEGTTVIVRHDPDSRYHAPPKDRSNSAFKPVFEDDHLLVVEKRAGVLTVPTDHLETNTLLNHLNHYLKHRRVTAHVVHRLDRGTSGLLVFGKSGRIAAELQDQFRIRKAEREYAALVAGVVRKDRGTYESRLGTTRSLQRHSVRADQPGEDAVTHFRVEQRWADATFVTARLETGRRNQIRVHFAEAGHPVLGDDRYRPEFARHPAWKSRRLALHAGSLGFDHPVTGEALAFQSELPQEFQHFLKSVATSVRSTPPATAKSRPEIRERRRNGGQRRS